MSLFIKKVQESALVGGLLLLSACGTSTAEKGTEIITEKPKTSEISNTVDTHATYLKTMFQDSFQIGTALSRVQILNKEPGTLALVEKHFDVITPENSMKWERIHPEPSTYDFLASDELVNFSKKNKIGIVGHTLVWHAQTPDWVSKQSGH